MKKKKTKQQYRICNWRDYNKALVGRGSLTLWFDDEAVRSWLSGEKSGRRGKPRTYADACVLCMLTLKAVYHLPQRATQGLVASILALMRTDLPTPHYSTLSRRARHLSIGLTDRAAADRPIRHLVVDATGLKVYGEGEWKVKAHGKAKRRTWRKLHVAMDASTHQLTAALVTAKEALERNALHDLLARTAAEVERVCGDGAYDFEQCYRAIKERGAAALIPPREGAVIRAKSPFEQRDEDLRAIRSKGRKEWKAESTYHRRSLVETAFCRLKMIFSDRLRSRRPDTQTAEALTRCLALNRMTSLGMPVSYAV